MTVLERIKKLCRERKNISITTLEQTLGYSNGSLAKAKDIPGSRIMDIAKYLGVSVEYLMTGETKEFSLDVADEDTRLIFANSELKKCFLKILDLPKDKQDKIISLIDMI